MPAFTFEKISAPQETPRVRAVETKPESKLRKFVMSFVSRDAPPPSSKLPDYMTLPPPGG